MANGANKIGITYPFQDSRLGDYVELTITVEAEVRSELIHLLLTRKGSRFFLPDFGTRLYEFIFEQMDDNTYNQIDAEIREQIGIYLPNIRVNKLTVTALTQEDEINLAIPENSDDRLYRLPGRNTSEYTAKIKIDYSITNNSFETRDFVIINI